MKPITYIYIVPSVIPSYHSSADKAIRRAWATQVPRDFKSGDCATYNAVHATFVSSAKASLAKGEVVVNPGDFGGVIIRRATLE